jgi:hypothetical protein
VCKREPNKSRRLQGKCCRCRPASTWQAWRCRSTERKRRHIFYYSSSPHSRDSGASRLSQNFTSASIVSIQILPGRCMLTGANITHQQYHFRAVPTYNVLRYNKHRVQCCDGDLDPFFTVHDVAVLAHADTPEPSVVCPSRAGCTVIRCWGA